MKVSTSCWSPVRQHLLDEVAASIRQEFGSRLVRWRSISPRLRRCSGWSMRPPISRSGSWRTTGADPNYEPFLANPAEVALDWCSAIAWCRFRCVTTSPARWSPGVEVESCSSAQGPGSVGAPNMVAYGATKAFDMVFGEALWAELHGRGVDVVNLVLAVTDTPALRRLLARRGQLSGADDQSPIPGAVSAEDVASEAVANIGERADTVRRRDDAGGIEAPRQHAPQRRRADDGRHGVRGHGRRRHQRRDGRMGLAREA